MAYTALDFIYDGIPSNTFGLFLCNLSTGTKTDDGGGKVKIITDKTSKMDHNYCFGVEYNDVLQFKLTFGSYETKTKGEISLINNWLIGKPSYRKLQIVQDDMDSIYYNCIMNDFKITSFGNLPIAFECTVICDRGWGLSNQNVCSYDVKDNYLKTTIYNQSHTSQIIYPIVEFTTNALNAKVSIKNESNNNWESIFTGLSSNETITLDCQRESITSSLDINRLETFNMHWFEMVPGLNTIVVSGNVKNIKIKYDLIRKVG